MAIETAKDECGKYIRYFDGKRYKRAVMSNSRTKLEGIGKVTKARRSRSKKRYKEAGYRIVPAPKGCTHKLVLYIRSDR